MFSEFFSKEEIEQAFYKCLSHGSEKDIAAKADAGYGILSQKFSPDNERESDLFRAAATLAAWIDVNPADGQKALQTLISFVSRALPTETELDINIERENAYRERADFTYAEASGKSTQKRIDELKESMFADERLLATLQAERKREIQREAFTGQPVSHVVRAMTERMVVKAGHERNGSKSLPANHAKGRE